MPAQQPFCKGKSLDQNIADGLRQSRVQAGEPMALCMVVIY
jgi:hypothetical protein